MEASSPRILLAYSLMDPAGSGVAELLVDMLGMEDVGGYWARGDVALAGFEEDVIYLDVIDKLFRPGEVIVLSRHSSRARVKSLTVHHTGNPGSEARLGGRPRELGIANPPRARQLLLNLYDSADRLGLLGEYDVTYEATHHGPTSLGEPLVFIEIGSTLEEWRDARARRALAEAVAESLSPEPPPCRPVAGFGGGHYARKHTRKALDGDVCYGHIYAKYVFREEPVEPDVIAMALERSKPPARMAIVEKKGVPSRYRAIIEDVCRHKGLAVEYI